MPALGLCHHGEGHVPLADHDETYEPCDAYYAPPGHTPVLFKGTEVVEFSDTRELERTVAVVMTNMGSPGA